MSLSVNSITICPDNPLDYLKVGSKFNNESVRLSTKIFKINRREKKQERVFLLTNMAIYNIKPSKDIAKHIRNQSITPQRRIDLLNVLSITLSTSSNQFTINIPSEYDYRYEALGLKLRKEIITAISNTRKFLQNNTLSIHKINQFSTASFTVTRKDKQSVRCKKLKHITKQPLIRLSTTDISKMEELNADSPGIDYNVTRMNTVDIPRSPTFISTMPSDQYYDHLISGFLRRYHHLLSRWNNSSFSQMKALCIVYYYKFMIYNDFCSIKIQQHNYRTKMMISTALVHELMEYPNEFIQYGGRLVSRIPINSTSDPDGVTVKIMDTFAPDLRKSQKFQAVAVNDYYAAVTDELDLKQGEKYMVMQCGSNGWWHIMDYNGNDGWVPSNYLKRIDGKEGVFGIGVTTNPMEFMNIDMEYDPFGSDWGAHNDNLNLQHVRHSVAWMNMQVNMVTNGRLTSDIGNGLGMMNKGDIVDVYIEDGMVKYDVNGETKIMKELLHGEEYYFGMVFSAAIWKVVKYEIWSDLL